VRKILGKINKDHLFWALMVLYMIGISCLAVFRDMVNDEALYFQETFLISELFKSGKWIGAYGVGVHGFLFKLPPALIFLVTGPSVSVVTVYHIILAGISGILAYKLFSYVLKDKIYGILATAILLSNFHFVLSTVTYLREIPSILVILLLINNVLRKGNKYWLSFLFLLLLDAKEYIFIIFAFVYVIWLFVNSPEKKLLFRIIGVIKRSFLVFLPSIVWTVLMFTTHIIPVNMFLASIIGLKGNKFRYLTMHLSPQISTTNGLDEGIEIPRLASKVVACEETTILESFVHTLIPYANTVISYVGKVLYPRVFSFLSVPKVIILPVIVSSFIIIRDFIKKRRVQLRSLTFLSILTLVWLVAYIARASHGRYLLPIVPAIAIIYVYILFKQEFSKKQKIAISVATFIYVTAGFFFEASYLVPKIFLEYSILALFTLSILNPKLSYLKYLTISLFTAGSLSTAVLFSYVQGQIFGYRTLGPNRNADEIAEIISDDERYWINSVNNYALISAYNGEAYLDPEWQWALHESVPIKDTLEILDVKRGYSFTSGSIRRFKESVFELELETLYLIKTDSEERAFSNENFLENFQNADWLELKEVVEFKNMQLYIFEVLE